ncbi:MAG: hypothetical protein KC591_08220, partial [Gemmatimonadetes bacterium]|nr:hypothetical protein [Gemmatimonadota bacterium]
MRTLLSALLAAGLVASPVSGAPLGTAFTYQGELTDVGAPVSGSGDFRFTLHDDEAAGIVVGAPLQIDDVTLAAGRFTVQLDFGDVFDGNALWLEIGVRTPHDPSDTAPFTILNPRQPLTAAPFAQHALGQLWTNSGGAIVNTPGFVGINRNFPTGLEYFGVHAPISNGYGGMYVTTEGANGLPFYGYRTFGGHSAWTYLDGPTGDWRLNVDGDRVTVTDTPGLMGVGTTNPTEKLEVAGTIYSSTGGFKFPDGTTQTTAATSGGGNTLDQ